ncbi:hypothetical protein GQX73_g1548 [Xylaria multiplex]|uniref:Uncharacterized protein n=1 Tax=Xylaria multiplex TaxID=323545 RepID=A0A7C8MUT7_9PEZI|nr:hypothetical protein GQX73_g1548 [Xylaria multiplex]
MQIMGPGVSTEPATPTDPCGINATPRFAFLSLHTAQPTSTTSKTIQSKRTVAGMSRPTRRLRIPTHNTSIVAQAELASSVTPMTRPRPSDSIRAIVESAIPSIKVETICIIPTKRLLRAFKVKLADERVLLLNIIPPPSRLLRYEKWVVQSETALVEWLSQGACQQHDKGARYVDEKSPSKRPQESSSGRQTGEPVSSTSPLAKDQLLSYLPTLIKHSSTSTETGSAFSLFEPTPGDPISSLGKPPTPAERRSINFQKGRLIRRIANIISPNGRFGQVATVLEPPQEPESSQETARETKLDFDGVDGWRKTFHLLLEGILRDGEDRAVTMSYELVRATFYKFGHLLDAVTTPRLVVCNAGEDDVVLVSRSERKQEQKEIEPGRKAKRESDDEFSGVSQEEGDAAAIEITGLQDWSNCIFGDPGSGHDADDEDENEEEEEEGEQHDVGIIEDPDNASARVLLYECYHATVAIVRQFYRPDADSSEREIAARRRLVAALGKLENVDADGPVGKRHRRPSRDDWPAKRPRGDTPVS